MHQNESLDLSTLVFDADSKKQFRDEVDELKDYSSNPTAESAHEIDGLKVCLEIMLNHSDIFVLKFPVECFRHCRPDFIMRFPNLKELTGIEITQYVIEERMKVRDLARRELIQEDRKGDPISLSGDTNRYANMGTKEMKSEAKISASKVKTGCPIVNAGKKEDCEEFINALMNIINKKECKKYRGRNILFIHVETDNPSVNGYGEDWFTNPKLQSEMVRLSEVKSKFIFIILFFPNNGHVIIDVCKGRNRVLYYAAHQDPNGNIYNPTYDMEISIYPPI